MTRPIALEHSGKYRWLRVRQTYYSLDSQTIYWWSWPRGLREIRLPGLWRGLGRKLLTLVRYLPFRAPASSEMDVWDEHGLRGTGF